MFQSNKNWIKNAIIYQILIDRFSGYNPECDWHKPIFCGGSIKGIIDKIPYLQNLGVNTLWISPFYKTNAYHGYHITDFFEVDPHFGSKEDIKNLLTIAHESHIKVIADFVPNHCSIYHPFFQKAISDKKSSYTKWFYFKKWPNSYLSFLSFSEIPKLNLEYKPAREYIIKAALYWLSFGFDGYRLDHVIGPSNGFWKQFVSTIKKEYPSTVLIGEAWMLGIQLHELHTILLKYKYYKWLRGKSSYPLLKTFQPLFDGVLDFQGQQILHSYYLNNNQSMKRLKIIFKNHYNKFNQSYVLPLFLDNHDMDRILFTLNNNKELLKKMATSQFMMNQPVIIYYGTEIGMTQDRSIWDVKNHGDIAARQPMQWNNIDENLLLFYQQLCHKKMKIQSV